MACNHSLKVSCGRFLGFLLVWGVVGSCGGGAGGVDFAFAFPLRPPPGRAAIGTVRIHNLYLRRDPLRSYLSRSRRRTSLSPLRVSETEDTAAGEGSSSAQQEDTLAPGGNAAVATDLPQVQRQYETFLWFHELREYNSKYEVTTGCHSFAVST